MMNVFKPLKKRAFISVFTCCLCFASSYQGQMSTMVYSVPDPGQSTDYRSLILPNSCKNEDGREDMGPILHAWCWTFKDVISHVSEIAEAGYKSIQVSPVQKEKPTKKDIPGLGKDLDKWYTLYQPLNFKIGNCLGSRDEFRKMCEAAHSVGLKIIVDVVANHLAKETGKDYYRTSYFKEVDPELLGLGIDNLFHKTGFERMGAISNPGRFDMTQRCLLGLPDLNTGNDKVQKVIIDFLVDLIECGTDGFRFDGAKHIELPKKWDGDFGSDFWPNVIDAIVKRNPNVYIYGELLPDNCTNIDHYLNYMNVTDVKIGESIVNGLRNQDVSGININYFPGGWDSGNFVTWVESHDTFVSSTTNLSSNDIVLGWAIAASKRGSVPLFLARPDVGYQNPCRGRQHIELQGRIGDFSSNTLWKDKKISELNKFRKIAADQKEYVVKYNRHLYITFRENVGAVIVNLGDTKENLYFDTEKLTRDSFMWSPDKNANIISKSRSITLRNGILRGEIDKKDVCVIYFKPVPGTSF